MNVCVYVPNFALTQPFYRMMPHNPNGEDLVRLAREHDMVFMGHSMLRKWPFLLDPLTDPHIIAIADARQATPAQVVLRWALQRGVAVIPRSVSKQHIEENASVGGSTEEDGGVPLELSAREMQLMEGLEWMVAGFSKPYSHDVYGIGLLPFQEQ
jgi:diketogulonate reductase-like aldo/keto reductase